MEGGPPYGEGRGATRRGRRSGHWEEGAVCVREEDLEVDEQGKVEGKIG